jgi:Spy/CpxP family protein refolding chaperone
MNLTTLSSLVSSARALIVSLGVSVLLAGTPLLAQAQSPSPALRDALRAVNLDRSQLRQLRTLVQDYQTDLKAILTPEQLETLTALQTSAAEQGELPDSDALFAQLNLSPEQTTELEAVRGSIEQAFEDLFTPQQLEQLEATGLFESF